jgi:hypothetical protein
VPTAFVVLVVARIGLSADIDPRMRRFLAPWRVEAIAGGLKVVDANGTETEPFELGAFSGLVDISGVSRHAPDPFRI